MPSDELSAVEPAARPVRRIPTDAQGEPRSGVGLCLSGGGYRAMVFHAGSLWRLNEAGWLPRLDRLSSVSGGSIIAAKLGLGWNSLRFDTAGVATNLGEVLVEPIRSFASRTVDEGAIAIGLLTPESIGERVAKAYRKHLFADATLQDLPERPRFVINATNLASGVLFRFSRPYAADWRVGTIKTPEIPLADAVAASSAFPPVLSPFELDLRAADWTTVCGNELTGPDYRGRIALTDGGVYDNLGLETVWKRCRTVLISDGGGQIDDDPDPPHDWLRQSFRVLSVIDNQVRDLRKRQIQAAFKLPKKVGAHRDGAYWGIRSDIARYKLAGALPAPHPATLRLAEIATRLKALDAEQQERLINWGYAITDAALRRWVDATTAKPNGFPYPERVL